jgi:leader peptidase (prepilin peptidase)/N-methyltransferase
VAVLAVALGAAAFLVRPAGPGAVIAAGLAAVLVVVAATDLERRIIPNRVVLPATLIVMVAHIVFFPGQTAEAILGALAAGAILLAPNLVNPSAMGMGDVKLAVLLGAGLGWGAIGALFVGFLCVFPFALATLVRGGMAARRTALPLGPFLALGGLVILIIPQLVGH